MEFNVLIRLLLVIMMSGVHGQLFSQNSLEGKILDEEGLPFIYCKLVVRQDSVILSAIDTDSSGHFRFEHLYTDSVELLISTPFLRYDTSLVLPETGFLELRLKDAKELDGFTVSASRPTVIRQVDRVIFNPGNIPVLAGGSAVDALEFAPGIYIQGSSVMTAGGKSCRILLNDKLIPLEGQELISFIYSIPVEDIQQIEIMEVVPLKFAANVKGGLIHIKLKAGAKSRVSNGSIRNSVRQGIYTCDDFGVNYSYRKNKFSLYTNFSGSTGNFGTFTDKKIEFPQNLWSEKIQAKSHYRNYTAGFGLNYEVNRNTEVGILAVSNFNRGYYRNHGGACYLNGNSELVSQNDNNADEGYSGQLNSLSFNLNHTFDTLMRQVSFVVDYSYRTRNDDVRFLNVFRQANNSDSVLSRQSLADNSASFLSGGLDFTLPFKHFDVTTGVRASFTVNDNDLRVYNTLFSPSQLNDSLSNRFRYNEDIEAAYLSIAKRIGKWSFLVGFRAEATQTLGNQVTTGNRNRLNYIQVNPQVFVMYSQRDNVTWNLSYQRSFIRPNYNELNPFKVYNSAFSFYEGNPMLKPSSYHNLNIANNYGKLTTSVYLSYGRNFTGDVILTDTITLVQRKTVANYLKNYGASVDFSYQLLDVKRWSMNLTLLGSYYTAGSSDASVTFNRISNVNFMFIGNSSYSLDKQKTFFLQLSLFYMSPWVQNIEYSSMRPVYNMGLKKTFFDRRLTMSASVSDLFRIGQTESRINTNGVTTFTDSYTDTQAVYFELAYNFGNRSMSVNRKNSGSTGESGRYKTK